MKILHAIHMKTYPCEPCRSFRTFARRHKYVSENCFTTYPKNRNQLIGTLIAFTVIFLMRGRGGPVHTCVPWVVSVTPTLIISVSISQQLFFFNYTVLWGFFSIATLNLKMAALDLAMQHAAGTQNIAQRCPVCIL